MIRLIVTALFIVGFLVFSPRVHAQTETCETGSITTEDWLKPRPKKQLGYVPVNGKHVLPKKPGTSTNCDFHIFAWQWFLYLMNPTQTTTGVRNYENRAIHPVIDLDTCSSLPTGTGDGVHGIVSNILKMPDVPAQAGSGDALYDKNTNIVFYNRRFTKNECGIFADKNFPDAGGSNPNFPTGLNQVLELKSSWRIMTGNDDTSRYYVISENIEGIGQKKLGLVGFHIVINTKFHPEFVWATFEHVDNAPDCNVVIEPSGFNRLQPASGWSFASESCNTCIAKNYENGAALKTACASQCNFNKGATKPVYDNQGNVRIKGTSSNICLDKRYGGPSIPPQTPTWPISSFSIRFWSDRTAS